MQLNKVDVEELKRNRKYLLHGGFNGQTAIAKMSHRLEISPKKLQHVRTFLDHFILAESLVTKTMDY
jgi:hypothetical protein